MITLTQVVIVEGKYDKIRLSSVLNANILTTEGFRIFRSPKKLQMIKNYALTCGIVLITDPDSAGFIIRNHLKSNLNNPNMQIWNVYLPDILGKESRKPHRSKEGKLGLEGMDQDTIIKALEQAGVLSLTPQEIRKDINTTLLYELGLSGKPNSAKLRTALLKRLFLPEHLSAKGLIDYLNMRFTKEEFIALFNEREQY